MSDLARRAVAAEGWRWMPGMRLVAIEDLTATPDAGWRLVGDSDAAVWGGMPVPRPAPEGEYFFGPEDWANVAPDLSDPATLGTLLALVREKLRDPLAFVSHSAFTPDPKRPWIFVSIRGMYVGATEAEALVAALEAPHV